MDDLQDPSAITDDTVTDATPDKTIDLPSSPAFPIPSPSASPPIFWDRSTWDPNSLGAMLEGQPVAPYRTQGQVQTDAWDALVAGPGHPGWSEPTTRRAIDDITTSMAQNRMPDGPFADSLRLLAARPNADPDLQAWAASDAAVRAGQHPFQPLWDMNAAAQAPQTKGLNASIQATAPDTDDHDGDPAPDQDAPPQDPEDDDDAGNAPAPSGNSSTKPPLPATSFTTSPSALATIRTFEAPGGKPLPRYGSAEGGTDTEGLGHKMAPGERTKNFDPEKAYGADIGKAENVVKGAVTIPLQQHQFDALVSFAMNEPGAFRSSTDAKPNAFLDALNGGDFAAATNQMLTHNTYYDSNKKVRVASGGLQRRRFHEADMFSNGAYRSF